jgi:transposase
VDAAHFVFGSFLGFLWSLKRLFVPTGSGRQRFNVLGAVDVINMQLVTVRNLTYVNSSTVCALLAQLASQSTVPITLVLDNARYQRCALVIEKAAELGIELLFLPPYSPNLNLIERLWKWVKTKCLAARILGDFDEFRNSIEHCLDLQFAQSADELRSLLTLNFQSFKDLQFMQR